MHTPANTPAEIESLRRFDIGSVILMGRSQVCVDDTRALIGPLQSVMQTAADFQEVAVLTTPTHFPGLGRVSGDTDTTATVVDDALTRDDNDVTPSVPVSQPAQAWPWSRLP
ncbi:hypothetical protein ACWGDT_24360 [Streptomyces avermitilis]